MHDPFEKNHINTDTIVVFSHGFIGSPNQFEGLADFAYQNNCSVLSLLLPGHGATAKEFSKFRLNDWEKHLESELLRVSSTHKNIILVGHSIGGLLSLNASLNKSFSIKSVLLISSPLKLKYSFQKLLIGVKLAMLPKSMDETLETYRKSNSITGSSILGSFLWMKQIADVYRLISKTKSNLPDITVPVTVIHSKRDETVSLKSAKIFSSGLANTKKRMIVLDKSRHAFYIPKERAIICRELLRLISSPQKSDH